MAEMGQDDRRMKKSAEKMNLTDCTIQPIV